MLNSFAMLVDTCIEYHIYIKIYVNVSKERRNGLVAPVPASIPPAGPISRPSYACRIAHRCSCPPVLCAVWLPATPVVVARPRARITLLASQPAAWSSLSRSSTPRRRDIVAVAWPPIAQASPNRVASFDVRLIRMTVPPAFPLRLRALGSWCSCAIVPLLHRGATALQAPHTAAVWSPRVAEAACARAQARGVVSWSLSRGLDCAQSCGSARHS